MITPLYSLEVHLQVNLSIDIQDPKKVQYNIDVYILDYDYVHTCICIKEALQLSHSHKQHKHRIIASFSQPASICFTQNVQIFVRKWKSTATSLKCMFDNALRIIIINKIHVELLNFLHNSNC